MLNNRTKRPRQAPCRSAYSRFSIAMRSAIIAMLCVFVFLTAATPHTAVAQMSCEDEIRECNPSEDHTGLANRDGDQFGRQIRVSGGLAVVGAFQNDGNHAGAAYIVGVKNAELLYSLRPQRLSPGSFFGFAIAADSDFAVIGAPFAGQDDVSSGLVYVFDLATGEELRKFAPLDAQEAQDGQQFGSTIALWNEVAYIGAPGTDHNQLHNAGAVYIFDFSSGEQLSMLLPNDPKARDWFGDAVVASEGFVAVTAPFREEEEEQGFVYVFDRKTLLEVGIIAPPDGAKGRGFGFGSPIAAHENLLLAGFTQADGNEPRSGAAYLIDMRTGKTLHRFVDPRGKTDDDYGIGVCFGEDVILVSAGSADGGRGAVFEYDLRSWSFRRKISNNRLGFRENYGIGLASSGDHILVGSPSREQRGAVDVVSSACPTLSIKPSPLIANSNARFQASYLKKNQRSFLMYSLQGFGLTLVNRLSVQLDLQRARQVGTAKQADGDGFVQWIIPMPADVQPRPVWFQVMQHNNKTNAVKTRIE